MRSRTPAAASDQHFVCVVNGTAAGGGYELALATDHIMLVDDGSAAVVAARGAAAGGAAGHRRPHPPRRQAQGAARPCRRVVHASRKASRASARSNGGSSTRSSPRSQLERAASRARAQAFAARSRPRRPGARRSADPDRAAKFAADGMRYRACPVDIDRAGARRDDHHQRARAPPPGDGGSDGRRRRRVLAAARSRANSTMPSCICATTNPRSARWSSRSSGDPRAASAPTMPFSRQHADHWLAHEIRHYWKRVLKRVDMTSRSAGRADRARLVLCRHLAELVFAADRSYMLVGQFDGDNRPPAALTLGTANFGPLSRWCNGLTRLASRFLGEPRFARRARAQRSAAPLERAEAADACGLVTFAYRRHRLGGRDPPFPRGARQLLARRADRPWKPICASPGRRRWRAKIFARLTAWQNWIFQRPNAVGPDGALRRYGTGRKPEFDLRRV